MDKPERTRILLPLALAGALSACGGGGGGGGSTPDPNPPTPPVANQSPVVTAAPLAGETMELLPVSLSVETSDPDGDKLTFEWKQTAGTPVEFDGGDTAKISFTAPKVFESETLSFTVTVNDGNDHEVKESIGILVNEGEGVLMKAYNELSNTETLHFKHPGIPQTRTLFSSPDSISDITVSPDRRWVAFTAGPLFDKSVHLASLETNEVVEVTQEMNGLSVDRIDWIHDGSGMVFNVTGRFSGIYELYYLPLPFDDVRNDRKRISGEIPDVAPADGRPDGKVTEFAVSPNSELIAMRASFRSGINEIYVTNPDGNRRRVSVNGKDIDGNRVPLGDFYNPTWSHDAAFLAFTGGPDNTDKHRAFVADPMKAQSAIDVTGREEDGMAYSVDWSPTDHRLLFAYDVALPFETLLYVVDMDADDLTENIKEITGGKDFVFDEQQQWSPDGKKIGFMATDANDTAILFVSSVEDQQGITSVSGSIIEGGGVRFSQYGLDWQWAPDSKHVAFTGDLETDGNYKIYVTAVNAPAERKSVFDFVGAACEFPQGDIHWSVDGNHLLTSCRGGTGNSSLLAFPVRENDPSAAAINISGAGANFEVYDFLPRPSGEGAIFGAVINGDSLENHVLYEGSMETAGAPIRFGNLIDGDIDEVVIFGPGGITTNQ